MVEYDPVSKTSGLKNAIKCAENVLLDKIVSADDGYVGICFYNTKERRNPSDFDSVYVYADLDVPDPQTIIGLEEIVASPDPLPPFGSSLGACSATAGFAELTDALWTCSTMFSGARTAAVKAGGRVISQRVFVFTNNSTPFPGQWRGSSDGSNGGSDSSAFDSDAMLLIGGGGLSSQQQQQQQSSSFLSSSSSSLLPPSISGNGGNAEVFRARERCLQKAKDLAGFGVKIELFAMEKSMSQGVGNGSGSTDGPRTCSSFIVPDSRAAMADNEAMEEEGEEESKEGGEGSGDGSGESGDKGNKLDEELAGVHGTRFPPEAFYCRLLVANGDEAAKDGVSSISRIQDLKERAWCKEFKKRIFARVPLVIGTDPDSSSSSNSSSSNSNSNSNSAAAVEIGVQLYVLCRRATKGTARTLDAATNQEVVSEAQWVCGETGAQVLPSQLKLACNYGGAQVTFTAEEARQLRSIPEPRGPCIRVLGFKPAAAVKPYMNFRPSTFVYPDEQMVKGSTVAFTALLEQMIALGRVAIARFTPRVVGSSTFLVALIPQIGETLDSGVEQPTGLHMIYLPYADDIRDLHALQQQQQQQRTDADDGGVDDESRYATLEHNVELAKRVVRLLNIDFSSRDFANPSLQQHYACLKAFALKTDPDPVPDLLVPDRDGMAHHAAAIQAFVTTVFPPGYVPCLAPPKAAKRPAASRNGDGDDDGNGSSNSNAPKPKKPCKASRALQIDWVVAVNEGSVVKATVVDLKDFLKIHGVKVPPKAKKDDLLALVIDYVGDHQEELNNEPPPLYPDDDGDDNVQSPTGDNGDNE